MTTGASDYLTALEFVAPDDYEEILALQSSLFANPQTFRSEILATNPSGQLLSDIAYNIAIFGPNPNRTLGRVKRRQSATDTVNNVTKRVSALANGLDKLRVGGIRGTQFQAAFPDLIQRARYFVLAKGKRVFQEFVPESVLPLSYQFPGSGPLLTEDYHEAYRYFSQKFTEVISQGKAAPNWNIIEASLSWKIKDFKRDVKPDDIKIVHIDRTAITVSDDVLRRTGSTIDYTGSSSTSTAAATTPSAVQDVQKYGSYTTPQPTYTYPAPTMYGGYGTTPAPSIGPPAPSIRPSAPSPTMKIATSSPPKPPPSGGPLKDLI